MILLAAMLMAQTPPPNPLADSRSRLVPYGDVDAALIIQRFGRCMARVNPQEAAHVLEQEPSSKNESRVTQNFQRNNAVCWKEMRLRSEMYRTSVVMDQILFRGALAEGLLHRSNWSNVSTKKTVSFALHEFRTRDSDLGADARKMNQVLFGLTDCVVASNPGDAYALVRSDAKSVIEKQAMKGLQDAISGCLPEGETVVLDRQRLRAAIAESLYTANLQPPAMAATSASKQD